MPTLELIYGPMFAGKSCELIRRIRLLKVLNKRKINIFQGYTLINKNFQ